MENTLEKLRYPIGVYVKPTEITKAILEKAIITLADFPEKLKQAVLSLTDAQLDTPYRPQGWTIRQVIHHCADSHINCFVRIKWTLTETTPTIKYYEEKLWSQGLDNTTMPIAPSLQLLEALHYRMVFVLQNLNADELERSFIHPEHQQEFQIQEIICLYAWHCDHHLAHITELKKRENW